MPARTLNDFFAGFFYGRTKEELEADMAISLENDRRKSNGRQSHRRKDNVEPIKIGGEVDKEQEVTVVTGAEKKAGSVWSWQEEFRVAWSETFLTKKRKKHPRKGE